MTRVLLIPTILLALIGGLCYLLSAGAMQVAGRGAERPIVFCSSDEIKTLDIGNMSWMNDIGAATALWEGLTAHEPKTLAPVPGVAESWQVSADGKTYAFHLRAGAGAARWSNGEPVTAGDFVFAWKRVLTPSTGADYIGLFRAIDGAQAFTKAISAGKPANLPGVAAPDARTLVVHLNEPCAYFLDLCAFPPFYPLNEASMRPFVIDPANPAAGYRDQWTHAPGLVTDGPYVLREWKLKQHLLLEPNPYYWDRQNVKCAQLIIKAIPDQSASLLAYQSGAVDILNFIPEDFGEELLAERDAGRRHDIHYGPVFGSYYFMFNCTRRPLNDHRVRKALAMAIDRQKIVDEVTRKREKPLGLIVPPGLIRSPEGVAYMSPPPLETNLQEARRLLAEAGYPGGQGMRTIEILSNNEKIHPKVAQALGSMWEKNLGIHVTYRFLERASFGNDRRVHNFDVARAGWYGDYTDPLTWLDLCRSTDGNNDGKYANPAYDALLDQAAAEPDPAKRFAILAQAEALLLDECPFIPLYEYGDGYIFDDTKIKGLDVNPRLLTPFKWLRRAE